MKKLVLLSILLASIVVVGYMQYVSAKDSPYATGSKVYTFTTKQLQAKAGKDFANGVVPLGDKRYTTTGAKKGYVYLCNVPRQMDGGAGVDGPWISGTSWNFLQKVNVGGTVTWGNANFSNTISGTQRLLVGNGLPINHTTGTYPVGTNDPAYAYDRNPNSIRTQNLNEKISANPRYSETPNCMGMEVGVMNSGVPLFNGFDAGLRDAAAHELQDSCSGHPERTGQYHYHSMSACLKNKKVDTIVGYALDGFPITGPYVTDSTYLTTDDLDVCHGITSPVLVKGKSVLMYHYVLTHDFPYSVSCFRGKPSRTGPSGGGQGVQKDGGENAVQNSVSEQQGVRQPPAEAFSACSGKTNGSSCTVQAPDRQIHGTCLTPPGLTEFVCVPTNR